MRVAREPASFAESHPVAATDAVEREAVLQRRATGIGEIDRVLGGGLVPGSVILLGGPPGIGKSTLLLQASAGIASDKKVLYASGEESIAQVASRAKRLAAIVPSLLLLAETRLEVILGAAMQVRGDLAALVVDSVQTISSDIHEGLPGNVTQVRAVAGQLIAFAKTHEIPVVLVGHVTKDGQLAGPRVLEHMVDVVLGFEGEDQHSVRLLRATKNRFGSTDELGVFEMTSAGLVEVQNPSAAFVSGQRRDTIGSCITATLEGSRPLLLEIQALLAASFGGAPRRNCVGADPARLAMLLAVLDRHGGVFVLDQDVFINVTGGMRLGEPAADLAVVLAIASSHMRRPIAGDTLALGEVGLTGELRLVPRVDVRAAEAGRLGFRRVLVPAGVRNEQQLRPDTNVRDIELVSVHTVAQAIDACLEA